MRKAIAGEVMLSIAVLLAGSIAMPAEAPKTIELWAGDAPGERGDIGEEKILADQGENPIRRLTNVSRPSITVYRPVKETNTGAAVLICPGGGYGILAIDHEGVQVAEWLNSIGVTGIVLKYRVPRRKDLPKHLAPLQDVQRAMSLVRKHAADWGIDPGRIGILGFSAGGHLSATAITNFDTRQYPAADDIDQTSCRPDFAVLVYPAYIVEDGKLAPELTVNERTPPTFFIHADDDKHSAEGSARFYLALKSAGVPAELHIFASGGHGFGMRPSDKPVGAWPKRCEEWMRSMGFLEKK